MSNVFTRFVRRNSKKLVIVSAFAVAMVSAVGIGSATKQFGFAASDCDNNAILRCGAQTPSEFIGDVRSNNGNTQSDLKTIYADGTVSGLSESEYDRFKNTAKMGVVYKDGRVVVDGQTVMEGANSMGRQSFGNPARKPISIGGKTYYYSSTQVSFASGTTSIPVMVMFDDNGVAETVIMTACGNPVWGTKKTPEYDCKALNKKEVAKDTYDFSTTVHVANNASVNKVVYDFGDGTPAVTKTNPAEVVRHKYEKAGTWTAKVTVHFNVPGGKVVAVPPTKCVTKIVVEEEPKPFYACDLVTPAVLNHEKTKFRFTVKTSQGNGAVLESADFILDNSSTVTGVTTKDNSGNIYREYEFARDGKEHTIVVKANFNLAQGVAGAKCTAKVKAGETPMCTVPGKEQYPVGAPECKEEPKYKCPIPGKENLPKEQCNEVLPAELPKTGMGGIAGIFVGTSALGAVAHRIFMSRRNRFDV